MSFKNQLNHAGLETRVENKQQEHCKASRFEGQSSRDCGRIVKTFGANRPGRIVFGASSPDTAQRDFPTL